MKQIKLTKTERTIENALLQGEYVPVNKAKFRRITQAVMRWRRSSAIIRQKMAASLFHRKDFNPTLSTSDEFVGNQTISNPHRI